MNTESIFTELTQIQNWPVVGLVFAFVIVCGYVLKFWQRFPNNMIPPAVILIAGVSLVVLAPMHPKDIPAWQWVIRNFIIGTIIGMLAWMLHNFIISKIEDYLSTKFSVVNKLLGGKDATQPTDPPVNNPPVS